MKLATLKDGSRDGQLVVVSRDLASAHYATGIATTLQRVLDDWNFVSPPLEDLYATLNGGKARHAFAFDPRQCMAPLPRAYQWADGSAYLNHVALVRKARGAEMPASLEQDPLMYQGGSDDLLGPCDDAVFASVDAGIDFEAELAAVTGDVPLGSTAEAALESVRLLMLANDWSLRKLIPAELAKGFGFVQSKPATAFSPVAVTLDELGPAWRGGRVHLPLQCTWNGRQVGLLEAGAEMHFHFGQLIAHLAKTRKVRAGSIVGSGTVSNAEPARGWGCIAEQRAIETIEHGAPQTEYMQFGDTIRIDMLGPDGLSVFGAIEQRVVAVGAAAAGAAAASDAAAARAVNELPGWLKHATVWLLLALGLFMGVQAWQARQQATRFVIDGHTLRIDRSPDGHYHWPGRINGREVEFLVDTGATGSAIPAALARDLGLPELGAMQSSTAGGVVRGHYVLGDLTLEGGVQAQRLRLAALPQLSSPLLGMDVLGRLRLQQDGGVLRIELQAAAAR